MQAGSLHYGLIQRDDMIAESAVAGFGDEVVVFNANSADAVDVQAGFESENVTSHEHIFALRDENWCFGMRESDAVPRVMREVIVALRDE